MEVVLNAWPPFYISQSSGMKAKLGKVAAMDQWTPAKYLVCVAAYVLNLVLDKADCAVDMETTHG